MTYRCFMIWFLQNSLPGLPVLFVISLVLFLSLFSLTMLADFSAFLLSHFSFLPVNSIIRWYTFGLLLKRQCILSLLSCKQYLPEFDFIDNLRCINKGFKNVCIYSQSFLKHIFWKVARYDRPKVPNLITCLCWWSSCDLIDAFFLKTHSGTNATITHSVLFILLKCGKF